MRIEIIGRGVDGILPQDGYAGNEEGRLPGETTEASRALPLLNPRNVDTLVVATGDKNGFFGELVDDPKARMNNYISKTMTTAKSQKVECQTCANRRYQDQSDDPGVSFQTPSKISPEAAPSAVMSHELEHVSREKASADREGKEVLSQTVTIKYAICPECGRTYVAGGETRTVTRDKPEAQAPDEGTGKPGIGE
ncbi:MAG: hypothetical protein FWE66_02575 [Oscillospiraceae bacterium]|nr:hypothetical protein [Oscillospiraceae bacterium]